MAYGITLQYVHNSMVWYLNNILQLTNVTNIIKCVQLSHMKKKQKSVNDHKPVNYETSSGGARQLPSNSTEEVLKSFGMEIKFIESWPKSFKIHF